MTLAADLALPERVRGARAPRVGEVFWIMHGPGVTDVFAGADLCVRGCEEAIWEVLRGSGFRRVVFTDYRRTVYFHDRESRALTRGEPVPERAPARRARAGFAGPMGETVLLDRARVMPGPSQRSTPRANDAHQLMMLDGLMTDAEVRTALVVPVAQTWLAEIPGGSRRAASQMLLRWISGQAAPRNLCVLLFAPIEFTEVITGIRQHGYPELATRLADLAPTRTTVVGYAEEAEIGRLVHHLRLTKGLRIADWSMLAHTIRTMAEQQFHLRSWREQLLVLAEGRIALSVEALGLTASAPPASRDIWQRLDEMVGMSSIKNFLRSHSKAVHNDRILWHGEPDDEREPMPLHLALSGSPGTGKTVVATMIGELYRDMGVLSRGHLVVASVEDLVSQYVSDTAVRTGEVVRRAIGGVLFIDEAYQLMQGHGQETIDRLVTEMENHRDDLAVVIAGYERPINELIDSNPGLASRFPPDNRIVFPDFEPPELHSILLQQFTGARLPITDELRQATGVLVENMYRTRGADFGNGRAMRNLVQAIKRRWADRVELTDPTDIPPATLADIPDDFRRYLATTAPLDEVLAELTPLVGLAEVKTTIRGMVDVLGLRQRRGRARSVAPHMLFVGAPGTGKTTVAQLMGRVFVALGLLVKGHVINTTAADLIAGYVGQTAMKTRAKVEEALDGVLFIDEAYGLIGTGENNFAKEAVTELVALMEAHRGRLVVIAAGYPDDIAELIQKNSGLTSRFSRTLRFDDYDRSELELIFTRVAEAEGYELADEVVALAGETLTALRIRQGKHFGNARAVRNLFDQVELRCATRVAALSADAEAEIRIVADDIPDARDVR
ncbi:AAA family ATPase [Nocardia caishijiensis]|uniref:SpoVK/Ycf46/Vps4 family AAA+-type ATPase n=1 Tax=Nocardia caishijiensis TaxID=184756 RepID=A0ABQ6YHN0_9NOCA|nr:AAA family ATPase [Nocardia caishijiensis]KAF0845294.1 SpoVK/Ycf46/Vps4 family AAA+-type ATPase [Nocardia caishijiensis]